jgi:hypothetical protein
LTAYNGMFRCPGVRKRPLRYVGAWRGQCPDCLRILKIYPTTHRMVLHKRPSERKDFR